jgi:uncharacterized protein (TIRG00374 family)
VEHSVAIGYNCKHMKVRHFFFFLGLIALIVLLVIKFGEIENFILLLQKTRWWILIFVVILRVFYYLANTMYFRKFFAIFKQKLNFRPLSSATVTMNFVNIVFPSGGISGISYIRQQLVDDVDSSNSTLAQLVWYLLTGLSYVILLGAGFLMLLMSNQVVRISTRLVMVIVFVLLFIAIALTIFLFNKGLTEEITYFFVRPINALLRRFHKRPYGKARIQIFYEQLRTSIDFLRKNWASLHKPFFYALLMVIIDMASIYVVFLAFGKVVNPGVVIVGYILATLASLASLFTSGIGAYEAGMVATFVSLGVPFDLAFSVTIVYRAISLWLFLPIGLYFYKHTLLDQPESKPKPRKA